MTFGEAQRSERFSNGFKEHVPADNVAGDVDEGRGGDVKALPSLRPPLL